MPSSGNTRSCTDKNVQGMWRSLNIIFIPYKYIREIVRIKINRLTTWHRPTTFSHVANIQPDIATFEYFGIRSLFRVFLTRKMLWYLYKSKTCKCFLRILQVNLTNKFKIIKQRLFFWVNIIKQRLHPAKLQVGNGVSAPSLASSQKHAGQIKKETSWSINYV